MSPLAAARLGHRVPCAACGEPFRMASGALPSSVKEIGEASCTSAECRARLRARRARAFVGRIAIWFAVALLVLVVVRCAQ